MVMVTGPMAAYCGGFIRVTVEAEYAEVNSVTIAPDFIRGRGRSVDPDYVSDAEADELAAAACAFVRDFLADLPPEHRPLRVNLVKHQYNPVDSAPFTVGSAAIRAVRAAAAELAKPADESTAKPGSGSTDRVELVAA
jgi:hypothetical protein